ncbi:hypothetical protein [Salipiger aestuarii]|uniref:hypothetical protein n=1 Tax=Salipiger aestuarii TaxID=568098 RepID=UPI0016816F05|nr:hypothetical protein [Salipiger aestuarii]
MLDAERKSMTRHRLVSMEFLQKKKGAKSPASGVLLLETSRFQFRKRLGFLAELASLFNSSHSPN